MSPAIRTALRSDLDAVLELMAGYYRDDGLEFAAANAQAMARLLCEPQWGEVSLLELDGKVIGYVALCIGYSLELGGNDAFVDEVFVVPEHRGRGYGRLLLEHLALRARARGVRALHLEVDRSNTAARELYASLGYEARARYVLKTQAVAPAGS